MAILANLNCFLCKQIRLAHTAMRGHVDITMLHLLKKRKRKRKSILCRKILYDVVLNEMLMYNQSYTEYIF